MTIPLPSLAPQQQPLPRAPLPNEPVVPPVELPAPDGLEILRLALDTQLPATSLERDENTPPPEAQFTPEGLMQDLGTPTKNGLLPEEVAAGIKSLYGPAFPLLNTNADRDDWAKWARELWDRHNAGVRSRLHLVERNRLFRVGIQWISSRAGGQWREPPKPKEAARVVCNMIGPALDARNQILSEQRPGFRVKPASQDPDDLKKAEAQQVALEYQYDQQDVAPKQREAVFWNQTDGVSFVELFWDAERGPWHEAFAINDQGQVAPAGPDGSALPMQAQPHQFKLGDIGMRVLRIEHVRVSSDATATKKPWYWVICERVPLAQMVREYGVEATKDVDHSNELDGASLSRMIGTMQPMRSGYLLPTEDEIMREQDLVTRCTVYCEPSEYLPKGLQLVTVGGKVMTGPMPLLTGMVPMIRWNDGGTDPAFFSRPIMDDWCDSQMRMNAILSKWVENVRLNAAPRLAAKQNSLVGETLVGGTMSVIEFKGLDNVNNVMRELGGMSLAPDAVQLFQIEKKTFEDLSGWNDSLRGSFSAEQSGRAILAIRENLERVFAPAVASASRAMTEWAKISLAFMKWGYTVPRTLGVEGKNRPDLARQLTSEDFDGVADTFVDPETMMPLPRALKLYLLDDSLAKGVISMQEYRRRLPFAFVGGMYTPDTDHDARARRVVEAIRQTGNPMALPILWQDNEAIHQDVLERELILQDDVPPPIRMAAQQRWQMLAQQAMMKMGGMPPAAPTRPGQQQQPGKTNNSPFAAAAGQSPRQQPLMSNNPGGPAANPTQEGQAGARHDAGSQH